MFVQRLRDLRPRGVGERRAIPLRRLGDERELADDERRAAGVEQRAVELAGVALEDAETRDLRGEAIRFGFRIAVRDPEEDNEARADLASGRRAGARDSLDDGSQLRSLMRDS
jgi:hypothetical protein